MSLDFLGTTSWKESEHRTVGRYTNASARRSLCGKVLRPIEQRMSDKGRVDVVVAKERLLEREDHRGPRNDLRHRFEAARPPRPHLRRDVVEDWNARALRICGNTKIEPGIVDEDHEANLPTLEALADSPLQREMSRQVAQDFDEPDYSVHVFDQPNTSGLHPGSARA